MHPWIAGGDDATAALRGLAFPGRDNAAGAGDDRDQGGDIVGFELGLDYEIEMAGRLVESLTDDFKPEAYQDEYRDAVLDLIKRKAKGEEVDLVAQEEPEHGDDLAAALEASLAGGRR